MKKNFKVIQLNGMSGIILAIIAVVVVVGSFVAFPVYGIKFLWNTTISDYFGIRTIRLSQASLLWFAALSVLYGYLKSRIHFKFVNAGQITENKLNSVDYEKFLEKIKEEEENEKINH